MKKPSSVDQFSRKEAKQRFEVALRGALNTPRERLQEISPKRRKQHRTRKAKSD